MIDRIIERGIYAAAAVCLAYFGAHWLAYLIG